MFVDQVTVQVKAGRGGDGCVGFRREKYVPRGGPYGGDGGNGGSIIFEADENMSTLIDFKYRPILEAKSGVRGKGGLKDGESAQDVTIHLPLGTLVRDPQSLEILCDLCKNRMQFIAAKGGKGGRGNTHFATSTHQTPREFEEGELGQSRNLMLELLIVAEVGLIGLPNAGKSTLLNKISNARSKVANYPFTTLNPVLGVLRLDDVDIVVADMPGLIDGAHRNVGLGHEFLRHLTRTRSLLFVLDMSEISLQNPIEAFQILLNELELYDAELLKRPRKIVANKIDLPGSDKSLKKFIKKYPEEIVIPVSALKGTGMSDLVSEVVKLKVG